MQGRSRYVLFAVAMVSTALALLDIVLRWFEPSALHGPFAGLAEGSAGLWPMAALATWFEIKTGLMGLRVLGVLTLGPGHLVMFVLHHPGHVSLSESGSSLAQQALWGVSIPLFLAVALHAERPIFSFQWKEPAHAEAED